VRSVLEVYKKILLIIAQIEKIFGFVMVFGIVISVMLQVFFRYVLSSPLSWVLELTTYCFIWCVFIGASYAYKQRRHIEIISYRHLSISTQKIFDVIVNLIVIGTMVLVMIQANKLMGIEARTNTTSLPIDLPRHLFFSLPVYVCSGLIIFTGIYFILSAFFSKDGDYVGQIEADSLSGGVY
jgi:TRAP-type C4-dicarboxylate transport system permease small subunit